MCHCTCMDFGKRTLSRSEINNKNILEVGSYDSNGSLRSLVMQFVPSQYIGTDMNEGKGVDLVCRAEDVLEKFGKERFDVVISTETLEHVEDWKKVISNIKNVCKPGGIILITTRSRGYQYHGYPYDYWRFELEDIANIFSDCIIKKLEKDIMSPGVFIKVQKPYNNKFVEKDLADYTVYDMDYHLEI